MNPTPSPIFFLALMSLGSILLYAIWQYRRAKAAKNDDGRLYDDKA